VVSVEEVGGEGKKKGGENRRKKKKKLGERKESGAREDYAN
jgi:hypothetical protein